MPYGDYYDPSSKSVVDGDVILAADVNNINLAVDAAFDQVADDLDTLASGLTVGGLGPLQTITPAADRLAYYTDADEAALTTITAQGRAILDDVDASAQRSTIGLSNVPNVDCTNASNITSGTLAEGRVSGAIARTASPTFTGTVSGISKAMVGLGSVDNTSDLGKPISTATQSALDLKANLSSPTFTGTVSGVSKTMVGLGSVDNTSDANKPVSTATQSALNLKANIASPTFTGTVSGITKSMVGLGNADNTSDLSKPISTATQSALNLKANIDSPTFTGIPVLPNRTYNISISGNAATATAVGDLGAGAALANIGEDGLTYAYIQNVSAAKRVLGAETANTNPSEYNVTSILDWIGTAAHGQILYRGASAWGLLSPGTSGQYLKTQGSGANPVWADVTGSSITSSANVATTSGTSVGITSLPSGCKKITVIFQEISLSSTGDDTIIVQIGSSSGYLTSSYMASYTDITRNDLKITSGFPIFSQRAPATAGSSKIIGVLELVMYDTNKWIATGQSGVPDTGNPGDFHTLFVGLQTELPGVLDRIRILTVGGAASFDNGSMTILCQ